MAKAYLHGTRVQLRMASPFMRLVVNGKDTRPFGLPMNDDDDEIAEEEKSCFAAVGYRRATQARRRCGDSHEEEAVEE